MTTLEGCLLDIVLPLPGSRGKISSNRIDQLLHDNQAAETARGWLRVRLGVMARSQPEQSGFD